MNAPSTDRSDRSIALIFLFAATLFISATLMFVLQPMFGKRLLPLLGGSPAVWNTCMVFYQSVLFLGYLYAHFLSTRQNSHRQIVIH
ncbi:MAG: spermidine synthase, partial [Gammaproteobacteria bacterium]